MKHPKTSVVHVINRLELGGAERLLLEILRTQQGDGHIEHSVVSLMPGGGLEQQFFKEAVSVKTLSFGKSWFRNIRGCIELLSFLKRKNPSRLHAWMYISNIISLFLGKLTRTKVMCAIHNCYDDRALNRMQRIQAAVVIWLGRCFGAQILFSSRLALDTHKRIPFYPPGMMFVKNEINESRFYRAGKEQRRLARSDLGVSQTERLIGMVARNSPEKGHLTFLDAAQKLLKSGTGGDVRFVLCGSGVPGSWLSEEIRTRGLQDFVVLRERYDPVRDLYSVLDVLTLPSHSESFGLTIYEAMLCESNCVVSDIEAFKEIPDRLLKRFPPGDSGALTGIWLTILSQEAQECRRSGEAGRRFILGQNQYGKMIAAYRQLWIM